METKKQLYPIKFKPINTETPWGRTSSLIADLGSEESEVENGWLKGNCIDDVMETYLERIVGESIYNFYGRQFPLTVRLTEIDSRLPLTVHPDDDTAMERFDALGKAELWLILEADDNAEIYAGFNKDMDARELYERLTDGSIEKVLNVIKPKKGDALYMLPGTIHSAKGRMVMAEIQEASEMNFKLYDWAEGLNESCSEQLAEALDFIDYKAFDSCNYIERNCCCGGHKHEESHECHCGEKHEEDHECHCGEHSHEDKIVQHLAEAPEFTVNKLKLTDPLHIYTDKFAKCIIYLCIKGGASIQVPYTDEKGIKQSENYYIDKGEAILIPADMPDFFLVPTDGKTRLLEILPEGAAEADEYIDPDTEAFLEGEDYEGLENDEDYNTMDEE